MENQQTEIPVIRVATADVKFIYKKDGTTYREITHTYDEGYAQNIAKHQVLSTIILKNRHNKADHYRVYTAMHTPSKDEPEV